MFGAEEYSVVPAALVPMVRKLENPLGLDPVLFTGALGVSGLSAYGPFYEFAKPKPGQTIFVSAASGAVGQIVEQLAKLEGLKVVGSVGSDEKLEALQRLAPEGLDIYFDNVGGETLDAALGAMKDFGRISTYMISLFI
jgi:NADPH-dependent curcumin reductase CurA